MNKNPLKHFQDDFLIRIAELTESGFTQFEAVQFLFSQYDHVSPSKKEYALGLLQEGQSLSTLLEYLSYQRNIVLQIYFGEQYGEVNQTLRSCYRYLISSKEHKKKFIKTIQYPLILIMIFFVLIFIVNQTVLPQFKNMYDAMGIKLSNELMIMTALLFSLPKLLLICLISVIIIFILYVFIYQKARIERKLWLLKKIPIINSIHKKMITYRISQELSFFIANGISMIKIIEIFKDQDKDPIIKYIGNNINNQLLKGAQLPDAVKSVGLFEESMIQFIQHGEKNSMLDVELRYYATYIMKKLETQIMNYIKWIQPIIFSMLGFMIITLYLVIILPMLQMMSGIQS